MQQYNHTSSISNMIPDTEDPSFLIFLKVQTLTCWGDGKPDLRENELNERCFLCLEEVNCRIPDEWDQSLPSFSSMVGTMLSLTRNAFHQILLKDIAMKFRFGESSLDHTGIQNLTSGKSVHSSSLPNCSRTSCSETEASWPSSTVPCSMPNPLWNSSNDDAASTVHP